MRSLIAHARTQINVRVCGISIGHQTTPIIFLLSVKERLIACGLGQTIDNDCA